jgi:hypothetical protein
MTLDRQLDEAELRYVISREAVGARRRRGETELGYYCRLLQEERDAKFQWAA